MRSIPKYSMCNRRICYRGCPQIGGAAIVFVGTDGGIGPTTVMKTLSRDRRTSEFATKKQDSTQSRKTADVPIWPVLTNDRSRRYITNRPLCSGKNFVEGAPSKRIGEFVERRNAGLRSRVPFRKSGG